MAVESDADLAAFFNADEFGVAATCAPPAGGTPFSCVLLKNFSDRQIEMEMGRPLAIGRTVTVCDAQGTPEKDGVFTVGAVRYRIVDEPKSGDADRRIWTMTVR